MRILFVATAFSPLAARWINQLMETGWEIYIYDIANQSIHPLFHDVKVYGLMPLLQKPTLKNVHYTSAISFRCEYQYKYLAALAKRILPNSAQYLVEIIQKLKPDIIHSLKMQQESYTVFEARKLLNNQLPCPWIYSVWGSDIYYWRKFQTHVVKIQQVLHSCDYLWADNPRDLQLATENGFRGDFLGVVPTGGGYPINEMQSVENLLPSKRKIIAVKGYQSVDGGQALTSIEALIKCGKALSGFKIVVHSAIDTYASKHFDEVYAKAKELEINCDVEVEFLPFSPPEVIWDLFSKSRIALAISNTDGTPNAMLEAMVMGAFPIQSDTGGLEGWIESGKNGYLVPYDNISIISQALLHALSDNSIVDNAYKTNLQLTREKLDAKAIQVQVIQQYQAIYRNKVGKV